ncbi:hypothetical protein Q9R29_01825 [Rothia sp. ARF10]|nr:hypothetical protein [Rothia sp. ARF10]
MPTVGHPSALSPAYPHIELTLPDDWTVEPGGDALVRAVHGRGGDLAPVLTAYVHTSREASTDDLVGVLASQAEDHEEGEAEETFVVDLEGREWTGLNVSWIEDGEPVYLVHLVTAVEAGEVVHLVRVTGRIAGPDSEQDYELVQSILETAVVDPMGGGA